MGPAHRALRILCELELTELELEGIEQDQAPDQRLAHPQNQLDGLHRLDRPDDPREHAEHAAFGARWHQSRRGRLGVEAAVAGAFLGVEH